MAVGELLSVLAVHRVMMPAQAKEPPAPLGTDGVIDDHEPAATRSLTVRSAQDPELVADGGQRPGAFPQKAVEAGEVPIDQAREDHLGDPEAPVEMSEHPHEGAEV